MCLAIPGIISITSPSDEIFLHGKVSFSGITKDVNLCMAPDAKIDDYVLVHVGVAISKIDEEEARQTFDYLKQMDEIAELNSL
jgi:hydrogenase expression/formation protein HypC